MNATETRTFDISAAGITALDRWIEEVGAQWAAPARTVFGIRLCLAELAANVLEHGVARSDGDHIVVALRRGGDDIEVEFLDSRAPFDPTAGRAERSFSCEQPTAGGLGLALIRGYASELTYRHDGAHNRVSFKMKAN